MIHTNPGTISDSTTATEDRGISDRGIAESGDHSLSVTFRVQRNVFDRAQPGLLPAASEGDTLMRCEIDLARGTATLDIVHNDIELELLRLDASSLRIIKGERWIHVDAPGVLSISHKRGQASPAYARVDAFEALRIGGGRMIGPIAQQTNQSA